MAPNALPSADDTWFDLVPLALLEFDERGHVIRGNAALRALWGVPIPAGSHLRDAPATLQRLCGWDAPLTLLALAPQEAPLQGRATHARPSGPVALRSQIWAQQTGDDRRFLCAIREADVPAAAVTAAIATVPAQPPSPPVATPVAPSPTTPAEQRQLLHELSTILESTPAGIAYLRGDTLVRCNRRFEDMLGLTPGTTAGNRLDALLAADPRIDRVVREIATQLQRGPQFESELEIDVPGLPARWYALSVRRIGEAVEPLEVSVVLSDITRTRTQQAQLEALGRERELMFTLSGVGIAFVKDGLIQSANPALSHLVGEPGADLGGRPLIGLYATDFDLTAEPDVMSVLRTQGYWQGERALRHADYDYPLWTEVALRLVNATNPKEGFIASFVNVDARHRAELNLMLQADRTRAILDSVFVGIVTLDATGIAWMNRSARRMFGGDLADFLGQPLSCVATSDLEHPFRLTDYLDTLQDGQSHTFECQVVGRDGRVFWVVGNAVVTLDESNNRHATYALLDIDRRRQAEAQSAEAQATLQRIIEMAPMAIQLVDAHALTLLQANQAASAFMGVDAARALGQSPEALYSAERARAVSNDLHATLDTGHALHREYTLACHTGARTWEVNYLPLARDGVSSDQVLVVASDVTEQRAAEQARLEAAIQQREMLVREVHHRIKNNLQGVAGLLQQIAARKPEVAPAISEVVGQVQAIAQVYGLQVGASGPLHLKAVVEAISQSVQRTFGRTIELQVEGPHAARWQLPEAESIPIALCLNELLTNAHKHGPGPNALQCALHATDEDVRVEIRSPGRLPEGFALERVRGGVSGLGLVRALLPRRSAKLALVQEGEQVLTRIDLVPPSIHLEPEVAPPSVGDPTGHQIALWPQ